MTRALVAVEDAVEIPIDPDPAAAARGTAVKVSSASQASARRSASASGALVRAIGDEARRRRVVEEADRAAAGLAVDDQIALAGRGARLEELDPRLHVVARPGRQRRLLTDDGSQVRIEREHERLDLAPELDVGQHLLLRRGRIVGRAGDRDPAGLGNGLVGGRSTNTVLEWNRNTVSVLPSCRNPKPRTWSPWNESSLYGAGRNMNGKPGLAGSKVVPIPNIPTF